MILTSPPAVSVVIPTYNRQEMMLRAVRSVLGQTVSNVEFAVVDGSEDGTPEALQAIGDSRIRIHVHKENQGAPAARNTGIRNAVGAFVAFLDDDDIWLPEKLETQLSQMVDYDASLCGYRVMGERRDRVYRLDTVGLKHLKKTNPFGGSGLMLKAFVAKSLLFDDTLPKAQDWDFDPLGHAMAHWIYRRRPLSGGCRQPPAYHQRSEAPIGGSVETTLDRNPQTWRYHRRLLAPISSGGRSDELYPKPEKSVSRFLQVGRDCGWLPSCHVLADRAWIHFRYR